MTYVKTLQWLDIMFNSGVPRLRLWSFIAIHSLHGEGRPVRRMLIFDVGNNNYYSSWTFVWCAKLLDKLVCGEPPVSGSVGDGYEITSADSKSSNKLGQSADPPPRQLICIDTPSSSLYFQRLLVDSARNHKSLYIRVLPWRSRTKFVMSPINRRRII